MTNFSRPTMNLFNMILLSFFTLCSLHSFSQTLSGTVTVGTGGDYASFTKSDGFFNAVNTSTVTGNITVNIISDITDETGIVALNQWAESGAGGYTMVIQSGAAVQRIISGMYNGTDATTAGLIRFNGADRVTINGGSGTNRYLLFRNYGTGNWNAALALMNDATQNSFHNCTFEGGIPFMAAGNGKDNGVVYLGPATVTGNDNNSFTSCDIGNNADPGYFGYAYLTPIYGFYALGTAGMENDNITISGCNIYNISGASNTSTNPAGIFVGANNGNNWTITGNSIFHNVTPPNSYVLGTPVGINFSPGLNSTGNIISGNFIGGNTSALSGGAISGTWTTSATDPYQSTFYGIKLAVGSGGVGNTVSKNIISKISCVQPFYGIHISSGSAVIDSNIISNPSTSMGGHFNGIYVSGSKVASMIIIRNRITDITLPVTAPSGGVHNFRGISISDGATGQMRIGGNSAAEGNLIDNITNTYTSNDFSSQSTEGIYEDNTTNPILVGYNTISNFNISAGTVNGIRANNWTSIAQGTVNNNTVFNINSAAVTPIATSDMGRNTVVTGIYLLGNVQASGNTIFNLSSSAVSAAVAVTGIFYHPVFTGKVLEKNFIHSLKLSTSSASGRMTGIAVGGPSGSYIPGNLAASTERNNMIRLGIDGNGNSLTNGITISGIQKGGSAGQEVYFNSVYIGGEGVSTNSSNTYAYNRNVSATVQNDNVRNNIFSNERSNNGSTGTHYAVVYNNTGGVVSNYNLYYAPGTGGSLGSYDGGVTPQNTVTGLSTASGSGQEANSISGDPLFINATGTSVTVNLHVSNSSPVESAGQLIASVTDDYDSDFRTDFTPVDIGADAINSDSNCPLIKIVLVTRLSGNVCNPINIGVGSSEQDITYYLLIDGNVTGTFAGNGADKYFPIQSAAGTYTVVGVNSLGCTTNMNGSAEIAPAPAIPVITGDAEICPGTSTVLTVSNPCAGCDYSWDTKDITTSITVAPVNSTTYTCTATNSCGSVSSSFVVNVSTCQTPTHVISPSASYNSITVSWDGSNCAYRYKIRYREVGATTWTNANVGVGLTTKKIYRLAPGTQYELEVRTQCDSTNVSFSAWSSPEIFETSPACITPTGIVVSKLRKERAVIVWDAVTGAYSYEIRYRKPGDLQWKRRTILAPTTSRILTNLASNTLYEFQIRTICDASGRPNSPWSLLQTFSTLLREEGMDAVVDNPFNIFPNPNNGRFVLQFESDVTEHATVEVYNAIGQKVYSAEVAVTPGLNSTDVQIQNSAAGIYLIHLKSAKQNLSQQIVVLP